jgi:drug/metabolite transporter (DMT)-like permease
MSLGVLLVVLCGALMHASWNVLVKAGRDTDFSTAAVYGGAGVLAAVVLPFMPQPAPASWPYLAASTVTVLIYTVLLAAAYRVGDLSHAYPLMRGTAPLLVALGSAVFIGEPLSARVWAGVALVSCGILSLILETRAQRHSAVATRLALLNAVLIALYTTIDGLGVRLSGEPLTYNLWLCLTVAVPWLLWAAPRLRAQPWQDLRRELPTAVVGGAFSIGSYGCALWAMTRAPVAAVAAVRETAIVFAAALGALVLRERVTPLRAAAAAAIALGVWAVRAYAR